MYVLPQGLFEELFEPIRVGFYVGIAIMILLLVFMMLKGNKKPFVWLIFHFIFLSLSGYLFFDALNPVLYSEIPQSVIYDEVKIRFNIAGVAWIISLNCLLIGIKQFKLKMKE
ncbi:MAG TPA: hypothetical protein GXX18_04170 [Bacillales bacterium]|nr:hypothetical protein [Bacillales bacterium]